MIRECALIARTTIFYLGLATVPADSCGIPHQQRIFVTINYHKTKSTSLVLCNVELTPVHTQMAVSQNTVCCLE